MCLAQAIFVKYNKHLSPRNKVAKKNLLLLQFKRKVPKEINHPMGESDHPGLNPLRRAHIWNFRNEKDSKDYLYENGGHLFCAEKVQNLNRVNLVPEI
jgi:hypothetical protein